MQSFRPHLLLLGGLIVALIIGQLAPSANQYFLQIALFAGINIILAVSLNLVNGFTGQFSLGHAGFMAVGAYTASIVSLNFGQGDVGNVLIFLVALLSGGMVAAVFGALVGIPSLRLRGDYLAIVTLGFGEIIRVIIQNVEFLGGARGLTGIPKFTSIGWVLSFAAITLFVVSNLIRSTYGKGFLAVRDDEVAAEAMGIDTTRFKVIAFVTGAFFAGLAGALYAHSVTYITPSQFGFVKSIEIVVMVIVGGMGHNLGVLISAILLTILPEVLRPIAEYRMVIYSLALILIMLARPQGLFGEISWLKNLVLRRRPSAPAKPTA